MLTRDDIVRSYLGASEFDRLKNNEPDEFSDLRRSDYIGNIVNGLRRGGAYIDFSRDKVLVPLPVGEEDQELYGKDVMKVYEGTISDYKVDENNKVHFNVNSTQAMFMSPEEAYSRYFNQCEATVENGPNPEYAVPVQATPVALQVLQGTYNFDYAPFDELVENHSTIVNSEREAKSMKHSLEHMLYKEPSNEMYYGQMIGVEPTLEALSGGRYRVSVDADEFDSILDDMSDKDFDEFRSSYEGYQNGLNFTLEVPVATDALMMDENMNYSGLAKRKYTYGFPLDQEKSPWIDCQFGLSDNPYDVLERADLSIYSPEEQAKIATYKQTDNIEAAKQVADTLNEQAKTQTLYQLREMERENRGRDGIDLSLVDYEMESSPTNDYSL